MDIRHIRKSNLAILVQEVGNNVSALARLVGTDKSYLSQILGPNGKRFVGDDLARRLEFVTRKTTGWMDEPHIEEEKVAKCRAIYETLLNLPGEKLDALITLFDLRAVPGGLGRLDLEAIPRRKSGPRLIKIKDEDEQAKPQTGTRNKRAPK